MKTSHLRWLAALALAGAAGSAAAHTGHGSTSLFEGLVHPFGADHLLAMFAVGLWSVFALPAGRAWMGPATFMLALVASAALGAGGVTVPFLEHTIAASVVLFAVMVMLARRRLPVAPGLALIAAAASLHGLAHGAEVPAASGFAVYAAYAAGFLLSTAALHGGGVLAGLALRRGFAAHAGKVLGVSGLALGSAGAYLMTRI